MARPVTDPSKIVTDPVVLSALAKLGVDKDYVEFFQDYAPRSFGKEHSPYAKFYRDLKSNKRFMVVSGLPMVNADGVKVEVGWDRVGNTYRTKPNQFSAAVTGRRVTLNCVNDQPWGAKKGETVNWQPQLFLDGIEQTPPSSEATLLGIDPINENYHQNVLEWDYGICRRRIRVIEGRFRERWIFPADPGGDVRIKHNFAGSLKVKLGYARDASGEPLQVSVTGDEEIIEASEFDKAVYPVEIGASQTFYPDAGVTSVDGTLKHVNDPDTWANIRGGAGTGFDDTDVEMACKIKTSNTTDRYQYYTWMAILFDTSDLPDDGVVSAAILSPRGKSKNNDQTINLDYAIYACNPASNIALEAGDYDTRVYTPIFSATRDWWDWSITDYNDFAFNTAGKNSISKTGVSKYALLEVNYDVGGATPFWADADHGNYDVKAYTTEQGSGYKPKLVVTYTILTVTVQSMTAIASTTAKAHGTVTALGESPCTQHGHCWSTSPNPTIADDKTELGAVASVPHVFESPLTNLTPATVHYVRAYATNTGGTVYSSEISFRASTSPPVIWEDITAGLPFTPVGQIFFSPIIGADVYIIDQGSNFYKLNLVTAEYTQLTSPDYGSTAASRSRFFRTLAVSPDGTKLACCSEGVWSTYTGSADYKTGGGRRVEIYNIAGNSWSASKQTDFLISATWAATRSLVWEDEDILWVWCIRHQRTASGWAIKCVKYTISTDTWTAYTASFQDTAIYANGQNCGNGGSAIKANKASVYGAGTGTAGYNCKKYNIAGDSYSDLTLDPQSDRFCHAYDRDKIWYCESGGTYQQGYIDTLDDSKHDDQFPENTELETDGRYCGIADDLIRIIAYARTIAPELMYFTVVVAPTVTTNPATSIEATTATLKGTLDDDGREACDVRFQYGETIAYGIDTEWQSGKESVVAFEQAITGLDPNKTYHFRAQARNSAGTVNGADRTFKTPIALPAVTTDPATEMSAVSAKPNGTLDDDGGEACDCGFEWGLDTGYSTSTPTESKATGETFCQVIGGLVPNTHYHFRAFATNSAGTSYGADRNFATALVISRSFALAREEL